MSALRMWQPAVVRPSRWQRWLGAALFGIMLGSGLVLLAAMAVRWWVS
jgi:hypothetical protein